MFFCNLIRSCKVFLRSGQFAIYETAFSVLPPDVPVPSTRSSTLLLKFVKVLSRNFDIRPINEEAERSVLAEQKRISRLLIPFVTSPAPGRTYSGVFFTGDRPCWILSTDKGGVKMHSSGHSVVHAFTACSLWESKGDFLLYSEEVSARKHEVSFSDERVLSTRARALWNGYLMCSWSNICPQGACQNLERIRISCSTRPLHCSLHRLWRSTDSPHMTTTATPSGSLMVRRRI